MHHKIQPSTDSIFLIQNLIEEAKSYLKLTNEFGLTQDEVAKKLGIGIEVKNIAWDNLFKALDAGEVDMAISSITITSERAISMAFSKPYFASGQAIVVAQSNTNITTPSDLSGKRVGVQKGTTSETEAIQYTQEKFVVKYEDYSTVPNDLKKGKIEAVIIDYPAAINMIQSQSGLKIGGQPFTSEFYGVAMKKGNMGLVQVVNETLDGIKKSGRLQQIEGQWFK